MLQFFKGIAHLLVFCACLEGIKAVTMQQFEQSLDMMRNGCAPKFKIPVEILDKLRNAEIVEGNEELKCYTRCIAALSGCVTKKGDFNFAKAFAQVPIILPVELQEKARLALEACKDAQKNQKDSCSKIFAVTKCVRNFDPESFTYP